MEFIIRAAWPNPQRNTFKVPFEMAARQLRQNEDVTLQYTAFIGAEEELRALLKADVDVAFATAPQIVSLAKSGANIKLVLGYLERQPFRLVTKSSIRAIEDLRGKTLSVQPGGGISEQALKFTVSAAKLEEGRDYKLVSIIPIPDISNALASGTIDGGPLGIDSAYHLMEQHPKKFHILGGEVLETLPRMFVVGWITTKEILEIRPKAVEFFVSHLRQAYNDAYRSDISTMARISKEMTYLEDYSLKTLKMSIKDYVGFQIWPKSGVVNEETWNTTISELRKMRILEEGIPFEHIAYHTLKGGY